MRKRSISNSNQTVNIKLISAKPSFVMFPTALFSIGQKFKWKSRFILGAGYLYALCYNSNKARTTISELLKVLSTNSVSRIYEFLSEIETLNRLVFSMVGGEHPEKFITFKPGKNGGTEVELIMSQELSYVESNNKFFPVPKISFLFPASAQAKAIYLYLHYLKNKESNIARVGVRRLAESLRLSKNQVQNYVQELKEIGVIASKTEKNKTEYYIKSAEAWNAELFIQIQEIYGANHPFLKEWKIEITESSENKSSNRGTPKVPIEGHLEAKSNSEESKTQGFEKTDDSSTTSNTTYKETTTSNYDAIYNGGGVKKPTKEISNTIEDKKEQTKANASSNTNENITASSTYNSTAYAVKNKVSPKSNFANDKKFSRTNGATNARVDQEELKKIKNILRSLTPILKARYPELFTSRASKSLEELYSGIKRIYGDEWLPLAVMYEMFNRKAPQYGYSRKVNSNYIGLLISFAYGDSPSSFWEFYRKFKKVFGIKGSSEGSEEKQQQEEKKIDSDVAELKDFLKEKLKDKKSIYRLFVDEGIRALERVGSKWVVKCKDSIVKEYVSKNFLDLLREFLRSENIQIEEI